MAEHPHEEHGEHGREEHRRREVSSTAIPNQSARVEPAIVERISGPRPFDALNESWQTAWRVFRAAPGIFAMATLTAAVISTLTLGILAGPMLWGVYAMVFRKLRTAEALSYGQVFQEFQRFGTSVGTALLAGVAVMVGLFLLVIPGLYLAVAFAYALPIAYDKKTGPLDSLGQSRKAVHRSGFWGHALLVSSLILVGWGLNAAFDWVGSVLGFMVAALVIPAAYELYIREHPVEQAH